MHKYSNDFKRFLKRFGILVISLVILDFLIGDILQHYYFKQKRGPLYRTTYAIDSTKADMLVFGSSRAIHHYVPEVFENKLHTSFNNCGRDACNLIYSIAIISAVLDRFTPKNIVIELNPNEFSVSEEGKLSPLLPYHDNPTIHGFLKYNSKLENVKLLSRMYPYNSMLVHIIAGDLSLAPADDNGYMALSGHMDYYPIPDYKQTAINADRIKLFDQLLSKLKQRNIQTTLVISPIYATFSEPDIQVLEIKKLVSKYDNVSFFNYENDPDYAHYDFFKDGVHLNQIGANKFSEDLANKLISRQQSVAPKSSGNIDGKARYRF